ncbi:homoserine dehydrogenase [Bacillus shivajii]|uniref:homoserine dehydrogenase n=1 Tax=Bacillus shivajii TaxID=1983719 RepID=UPI001CFBA1B4|nr:homoserine dehydrogenase [Bacillus shivajii]UCZ51410.1 homoserine dehydrogenase [Bacillus shivajii]
MALKIAFIGFGGVGQALAKLLEEKKDQLIDQYDIEPCVVAVSDVMKGSVYNPDGLNINKLLTSIEETGSVENYSDKEGLKIGLTSLETIKETNADVIVEVTFTDVNTGQPAIDHCRTAFECKKSVITTNKGPVALAYKDLAALAKENNVFWGFEGTVMSGTPALRLPITSLAGNEISEITGILNGTTNFMFTEMENGKTYDEALETAQRLGYAEADPTSDVEGYDARYKAVILANYVMKKEIKASDVQCEGMRSITKDMVAEALAENKRWRLITRVKKDGNNVYASVRPEKLDVIHPLANVTGATNAIIYDCDLSGPIMLTGAGAGLVETGYSLLIDLIHLQSEKTIKEGGASE